MTAVMASRRRSPWVSPAGAPSGRGSRRRESRRGHTPRTLKGSAPPTAAPMALGNRTEDADAPYRLWADGHQAPGCHVRQTTAQAQGVSFTDHSRDGTTEPPPVAATNAAPGGAGRHAGSLPPPDPAAGGLRWRPCPRSNARSTDSRLFLTCGHSPGCAVHRFRSSADAGELGQLRSPRRSSGGAA